MAGNSLACCLIDQALALIDAMMSAMAIFHQLKAALRFPDSRPTAHELVPLYARFGTKRLGGEHAKELRSNTCAQRECHSRERLQRFVRLGDHEGMGR